MDKQSRLSTAVVLVAFLVLITQLANGQTRMGTVDGYCYLEDTSDHSGVTVLFVALTPSAQTDSTFTVENGHYLIGLLEGIYHVSFRRDGYFPDELAGDYTIANQGYTLPEVTLTAISANDVFGDVSGIWEAGTMYFVTGELVVQVGETLSIEPGVEIRFTSNYSLNVFGTLLAVGAESDSIYFTSDLPGPAPGDWGSVIINGTSSGSILQYCTVKYGGNGIICKSSSTTIANNSIIVNGGAGIHCQDSSPTVMHNTIANNNGHGISCAFETASPTITGNIITNNGGNGIETCMVNNVNIANNTIAFNQSNGIRLFAGSAAVITGNAIVNNNSSGIYGYEGGWGTVTNNTISNNTGDGIASLHNSSLITNNIITFNLAGISDTPTSTGYNNVWSNITDYSGGPAEIGNLIAVNANGDPCDPYFNIAMDPLLVDEAGLDFRLQEASPCIDAGNPDPAYYDDDGTISDIGAFPFYHGTMLPPEIDFSVSGTEGGEPYPVQFYSSNSGGPVLSYHWDFGDGIISDIANPVHSYWVDVSTSFTVTLVADGPGGVDVVSYSDLITVHPVTYPPVAEFSGDPLLGFGTVQFTDLSSGEVTSWMWDFGDGGSSADQNPKHIYAAGIYTVSLTVTGPYGSDEEIKTDYMQIIEPAEVVAQFEPSATSGIAPVVISFVNRSIGSITGFSWDFGDGETSFAEHATHEYPEPGQFTVTLIVTGVADVDTAIAELEVLDPAPRITSVVDVPGDQGGEVYIIFTRSAYDTGPAGRSELYSIERKDSDTWVNISSGVATGTGSYTFLVSTQVDSCDTGPGLTEFRVLAGMDEGVIVSLIAVGYSVDNIPPGQTTGLVADTTPDGIALSWNASTAPDLLNYFVIRREISGVPMEIASTTSPRFTDYDPNANPGTLFYYAVYGVDNHGNVGEPSDEIPAVFPVSTMLAGFRTIASPDGVVLAWELSSPFGGMGFVVSRSLAGSNEDRVLGISVETLTESSFSATDNTALPGETYDYVVEAKMNTTTRWPLFVSNGVRMPQVPYALHPCVPNPFNPMTTIKYDLQEAETIDLRVYDISGRLVRVLVGGVGTLAGQHEVAWNGQDDYGQTVAAGIYFYRFQAGAFNETRRMTLLK